MAPEACGSSIRPIILSARCGSTACDLRSIFDIGHNVLCQGPTSMPVSIPDVYAIKISLISINEFWQYVAIAAGKIRWLFITNSQNLLGSDYTSTRDPIPSGPGSFRDRPRERWYYVDRQFKFDRYENN